MTFCQVLLPPYLYCDLWGKYEPRLVFITICNFVSPSFFFKPQPPFIYVNKRQMTHPLHQALHHKSDWVSSLLDDFHSFFMCCSSQINSFNLKDAVTSLPRQNPTLMWVILIISNLTLTGFGKHTHEAKWMAAGKYVNKKAKQKMKIYETLINTDREWGMGIIT